LESCLPLFLSFTLKPKICLFKKRDTILRANGKACVPGVAHIANLSIIAQIAFLQLPCYFKKVGVGQGNERK